MKVANAALTRKLVTRWYVNDPTDGSKAGERGMLEKWAKLLVRGEEVRLFRFRVRDGVLYWFKNGDEWLLDGPTAVCTLAKLLEDVK